MSFLTVDPDTHEYYEGGYLVSDPSVTTVIDSVGVRKNGHWNTIGGGDFKCDEVAGTFGSAFHATVGYFEAGKQCEYDDQMEPWVKQYRRFRKKYPILGGGRIIEQPMRHRLLRYVGTPDCAEYRNGVLYIWDWKTGEAFAKEWKVQLAAYRELVLHELGLKSNTKTMLNTVRFSKDDYHIDNCNDPIAFNKFRSLLNVYHMAA